MAARPHDRGMMKPIFEALPAWNLWGIYYFLKSGAAGLPESKRLRPSVMRKSMKANTIENGPSIA
jgi:hypothetical protein